MSLNQTGTLAALGVNFTQLLLLMRNSEFPTPLTNDGYGGVTFELDRDHELRRDHGEREIERMAVDERRSAVIQLHHGEHDAGRPLLPAGEQFLARRLKFEPGPNLPTK